MTDVHQWREVHCSAFFPCFSDHLTFVSDFRQLPSWYFLEFSHYVSNAACASGIFRVREIGIKLCTRLWWLNEFIPFSAIWSSWYLWGFPNTRTLTDSPASTIKAYFVLCSPIVRQVSLLLRHTEALQGIAAGIGMSNFLRAFFMVCLNSSSSVQRKRYHVTILHCRPLVSPRFDSSDICFYMSGHNLSGCEVDCFLVSLFPDHVYPPGGISLNIVNLKKPVHVSDNSRSPSTFQ